jgi:hypothetical protein
MGDRTIGNDSELAVSAGLVGWALTGPLMAVLNEKRLLSRREGLKVIDQALSILEGLSATKPHQVLDMARELLEREMVAWSNTAVPLDSLDARQ